MFQDARIYYRIHYRSFCRYKGNRNMSAASVAKFHGNKITNPIAKAKDSYKRIATYIFCCNV